MCVDGTTNRSNIMSRIQSSAIAGYVKPGFEAVREAFVENFTHRHELGAACCIYYRGEKVVDLWGGIRNKATGDPWEEDTMVLVYSATKGMAGLTMALAQSRGLFDYDELVSTYWPEFTQQDKEQITVRQLLAHQAGLYAFNVPVDKSVVADLDRLATIMAQEKPGWQPGTRQGYHALTLGFYEGELLRRVDPGHRSLGQFFQEELASPLGLDFYIRLPEEIPNSRLAVLQPANWAQAMFTVSIPFMLAAMNPHSPLYRALVVNPGSAIALDPEHVYARNLEVPSGGGVGTARAMAQAYSEFATGGRVLGVHEDTLRQLMAPAVPPLHGFYDECVRAEVQYSLGFMKPFSKNPFGHPSAFGAPGAGGSMGFADPQAKVGYGYVLNRMGTYLEDPRDLALRTAMYQSIGETPSFHARGLEESVSRSTTREH
jgi:CubicO group peptidase (beta-lactamase class C family)